MKDERKGGKGGVRGEAMVGGVGGGEGEGAQAGKIKLTTLAIHTHIHTCTHIIQVELITGGRVGSVT